MVAVTSGANINFDRLRLVSELADIGALREAMLATTIPEQPGAFLRFIQTALDPVPDIQVTEFKYRCAPVAPHGDSVLYVASSAYSTTRGVAGVTENRLSVCRPSSSFCIRPENADVNNFGMSWGRYSAGGVAHVLFSVGVGGSAVLQDLLQRMNDGGMPTRDISGIEAAQVGAMEDCKCAASLSGRVPPQRQCSPLSSRGVQHFGDII